MRPLLLDEPSNQPNPGHSSIYRRIGHTPPFTCQAVAQKLETQNQKEDQISIRTTPDNAESEVFSDSRRFFHDFFLEKVILYGEVAI